MKLGELKNGAVLDEMKKIMDFKHLCPGQTYQISQEQFDLLSHGLRSLFADENVSPRQSEMLCICGVDVVASRSEAG